MTADRTGGEDRTTAVDNGRKVGNMTLDIGIVPGTTTNGYYEYCVVKYERSTSVPVIGTDPVPSTADIVSDGLQRSCRSSTPGYVIKYGMIPLTSETSRTVKLSIRWAKFHKEKVRDGDYFTIVFFNHTGDGSCIYDLQCRYKTYG